MGNRAVATVEIDGRSGQIVTLYLLATNFWDYTFDKQLRQLVYKPDNSSKPIIPKGPQVLPYPTTNQAVQVIQHWLSFCQRLDVESGEDTNLEQINWNESFLYTNHNVAISSPICRITFTNKACFESLEGEAYDHFGSDAFFVGLYESRPQSDWDTIQGKGTKAWTDLANILEGRVQELLKKASYQMPNHVTNMRLGGPDAGVNGSGMTRVVVEWRAWHEIKVRTPASEFPLLFFAEFDLTTGKTKSV